MLVRGFRMDPSVTERYVELQDRESRGGSFLRIERFNTSKKYSFSMGDKTFVCPIRHSYPLDYNSPNQLPPLPIQLSACLPRYDDNMRLVGNIIIGNLLKTSRPHRSQKGKIKTKNNYNIKKIKPNKKKPTSQSIYIFKRAMHSVGNSS